MINEFSDAQLAEVFKRLVRHLQHRNDAQNVDLMGLAGFCRNCLGDWLGEAAGVSKDQGRDAVYGMPYSAWKEKYQQQATEAQLSLMAKSLERNEGAH